MNRLANDYLSSELIIQSRDRYYAPESTYTKTTLFLLISNMFHMTSHCINYISIIVATTSKSIPLVTVKWPAAPILEDRDPT